MKIVPQNQQKAFFLTRIVTFFQLEHVHSQYIVFHIEHVFRRKIQLLQ